MVLCSTEFGGTIEVVDHKPAVKQQHREPRRSKPYYFSTAVKMNVRMTQPHNKLKLRSKVLCSKESDEDRDVFFEGESFSAQSSDLALCRSSSNNEPVCCCSSNNLLCTCKNSFLGSGTKAVRVF